MIENIGKNEEKFFEYDKILYDAIHKKLKKKYYTYKELCDMLDQSPAEGNKKKRHIKELQRYMDLEYNKKTKKYKILQKYDTPLPPYPEEPSNAIYAKHAKTLLLNYILRHKEDTGITYINAEKLYLALGMINSRYIEYKKDNKKKLKDELTVELVINKEHSADKLPEKTLESYIDDFYNRSRSKLSTILKGALDTLQNQSYLTYSRAYKIYRYGKNVSYSTDAEIKDINTIERAAMDEFGFKSEKDIWFSGKTREYWNRVLELVQEIDPDVYGLYRCYKIIGSEINIQKALSREEESKEMYELNQKILNFIDSQADKNVHKSTKQNPYNYTKQLSDRYIDAQKYLSSRLIKNKERKETLGSIIAQNPMPGTFDGLIFDDDPDWFKN